MPTDRRTSDGSTSSGEPADRGVGHLARVLDQRLDRAERLGEREQLGARATTSSAAASPPRSVNDTIPPKSRICFGGDGVPGMVGELRVEHPLDRRVADEQVDDRAGVGAVAVHAHGQRLDAAQHEVAVERRRAPHRPRSAAKRRRSASSSSSMATKPPTTSECPPRYFVAEWTTTSAPSSSGRCRYGVANVLSTTTSAPCSWATAATAAMSTMFSAGWSASRATRAARRRASRRRARRRR